MEHEVLVKKGKTLKERILELRERQPSLTPKEASDLIGCSYYWAQCVLEDKVPVGGSKRKRPRVVITRPKGDRGSQHLPLPKWITVPMLAQILEVSYKDALSLVSSGRIKTWRLGPRGRWRVSLEDAERLQSERSEHRGHFG